MAEADPRIGDTVGISAGQQVVFRLTTRILPVENHDNDTMPFGLRAPRADLAGNHELTVPIICGRRDSPVVTPHSPAYTS